MNRGTVSAEFRGKRYDAEWRLENKTLTVSNTLLGEKVGDLAGFRPAELARMLLVEMYFEATTHRYWLAAQGRNRE
jgi:hypothetical protein